MDNEIINEEVSHNYSRKRLYRRSQSFSLGINDKSTKPRTAPNIILTDNHNYNADTLNNDKYTEYKYSDNNNIFNGDDFIFNDGMKQRNFSISNGNSKEIIIYQQNFPKKLDSVVNNNYDDLTTDDTPSIVNEMKHFYKSFTIQLELNDKENDKLSNNNSKEINTIKENNFKSVNSIKLNKESNNDYDNNEVYSIEELTYEKKTGSENILLQIHNNKKYGINDNKTKDDNTDVETQSENEYSKGTSVSSSSLSYNSSYLTTPHRRRSSLLQLLFSKTRSRNNSYIYSSQISSDGYDGSSNSVNNSLNGFMKNNGENSHSHRKSKSVSSGRESSLSLLYNKNKEASYDISDILEIGTKSPIIEEDFHQEIHPNTIKNKFRKKRNSRDKRRSAILENGHDISAVLSLPNIELIGRKSYENIVISIFLAEKLRKILPPYYRECHTWELVYNIIDYGSSISTLLTNCEETHLNGSFLLAILDTEGRIYGAYLSEILHVSKTFYGSGECFLWRLDDENKEIEYFRGSSENQYHIVTDRSFIAFGGGNGDFGLYISSDLLNGYTAYCPTYNNPPLTPSCKFECVNIELWGFNFSK